MVEETVNSNRMEELEYVRKRAELQSTITKEGLELIAKGSEIYLSYVTIKEANILKRWRTVATVWMSSGIMDVKDRKYYDGLKKVAEQLPWIEKMQKNWKFGIDEDISAVEQRGPGTLVESNGNVHYETGSDPGMPYSKAMKKKESSDMKPRYEKIEHVGK